MDLLPFSIITNWYKSFIFQIYPASSLIVDVVVYCAAVLVKWSNNYGKRGSLYAVERVAREIFNCGQSEQVSS